MCCYGGCHPLLWCVEVKIDAKYNFNGIEVNDVGSYFSFTLHGLAMADAVGCTLLRVLHGGHTEWVRQVVLSRDGTRLASYDQPGRVVVWDVATGQC